MKEFALVARTTVNELLAAAQKRLDRVEAHAALEAAEQGAIIIDIRSEGQRAAEGAIPGAVPCERNALEWRVDPASGFGDARIGGDLDRRLILVCDEGFQSSLAASTLQDLGFSRATDLVGGFQAWKAAGLPIEAAQT